MTDKHHITQDLLLKEGEHFGNGSRSMIGFGEQMLLLLLLFMRDSSQPWRVLIDAGW